MSKIKSRKGNSRSQTTDSTPTIRSSMSTNVTNPTVEANRMDKYSVQSMVLSFFHSFQQDSIPIHDQRLQSMASTLDKEMDIYILNHALSIQCNLQVSSDDDKDDDDHSQSLDNRNESFSSSETKTISLQKQDHNNNNFEKDFIMAIRHVLLASLTFAAPTYLSEIKKSLHISESSLFLQSPSVKILKLLSVYFFRHQSKYFNPDQGSVIILELYSKLSSAKYLEEDVRAVICWWFGICITQALTKLATESRRRTLLGPTSVLEDKDHPLHKCLEKMNHLLLHLVFHDKSQKVRYAAIVATCSILHHRANHGTISLDTKQVLHGLLYAMANDSSCQNRSAVLANIPMYEDTSSPIINRVRDIHTKVRVEALHTLETKIDVFHLSTQQRVDILRFGLTPRCNQTFEATATLLCCSWLKSMKFDTIALVRLLDPVKNEKLCELVIQTILTVAFNAKSISSFASHYDMQNAFIDIQHNIQDILSEHELEFWKTQTSQITVNLSSNRRSTVPEGEINTFDCPSSFYLRCHIQWALKTKVFPENYLSNILPDVPSLCQVLVDINKKIQCLLEENNADTSFDNVEPLDSLHDLLFTCKQVFHLFKFIDWSEEGSRRHFLDIATKVLSSVDTHIDVIGSCLEAMRLLYELDADFLSAIENIVLDLSKKYSADVTQEMKDIHCLDILSASLCQCSRKGIRRTTMESLAQIILRTVISDEPDIREAAVECVGRFALLLDERQVLEKFNPLLIQICLNEQENDEIRAQAIMALCDLAVLYASVLAPIVVNESQSISYLACLESLLESSKSSLLYVAAECVLKLHFADQIHDSSLLAYLVLLYFGHDSNSTNQNQENLSVGSPIRLHQLLSLFFPAYGMKSTRGSETLLHTCTDVRRLVQQHQLLNVSETRGRRRKSPQWPLDKMLDFLESCVDEKKDPDKQEEDGKSENSE